MILIRPDLTLRVCDSVEMTVRDSLEGCVAEASKKITALIGVD